MKRSKSDEAARRFVLLKWSELPAEKRQTVNQAAGFAMSIESELQIVDAYQKALVWLKEELFRT